MLTSVQVCSICSLFQNQLRNIQPTIYILSYKIQYFYHLYYKMFSTPAGVHQLLAF
jgi:hypothetical protein